MTGIGIEDSSSSEDTTDNVRLKSNTVLKLLDRMVLSIQVTIQADSLPLSLLEYPVPAPKSARLPEMLEKSIERIEFKSDREVKPLL